MTVSNDIELRFRMKPKETTNRPTSKRRPKRFRFRRILLGLSLGFAVTGMSGCTIVGGIQSKLSKSDCLDEFIVSHRNKVMSARAWMRVRHCYLGRGYIKDFRAGFIAGYLEVATGGSGCTPLVVSPQYWGWRHQCGSGQAAVNAWFEGFPHGVKAAEQDGIGAFNQIRLNTAQYVTPGMTGTAAPTPAYTAPAPQPTLPPGIILGEGETLVPGKVVMQDVQPDGDSSGSLRSREDGLDDPEGGNSPETVPDKERKSTGPDFDNTDPFSSDLGSSRDNISSFGHLISKSGPESATDAEGLTTTDLIPLPPRQTDRPELAGPGDLNEPSQQDIDSVIEEIFGSSESK